MAFFKTVSAADRETNAVLSALFEAKAFSFALNEGIGAFLLICALPFVFAGLGYLMHEFLAAQQHKRLMVVLGISLQGIIFYNSTKGHGRSTSAVSVRDPAAF